MDRLILKSYKTHNPFTFSGAGQTRAALSKQISSHEKETVQPVVMSTPANTVHSVVMSTPASLAQEGEDSPGVCTTACKFFS